MPPNSVRYWIRSRNRSLRLLPMALTTRKMSTTPSPNILLRLRLSYSRVEWPILSASAETDPTQRDRHIQVIAEQGRMAGQKPRATMRELEPRAR